VQKTENNKLTSSEKLKMIRILSNSYDILYKTIFNHRRIQMKKQLLCKEKKKILFKKRMRKKVNKM